MTTSREECSGSTAADNNTSTNNLPASQACAACKFQRRKCSADCPLAPYFPSNRLQDFQNVRRLFGVKNVLKTLGDLEPSKRFLAVECMIFEANCRAHDLVGGCYRIIAKLQGQITQVEAQRNFTFHQLAIYRQAAEMIDPSGSRGGVLDFDRKPGLISSYLFDCGESTINDWENSEDRLRKDYCSVIQIHGVERRLIKKENEVDFNLQVSH